MTRPLLALSVGDPAGIGCEIALRLLAEGDLPARLLLLGDRGSLERASTWVHAPVPPSVEDAATARRQAGDAWLLESTEALCPLPEMGRIDARAGAVCHAWVELGARLALEGAVDALVTGPIHKEAWRLAGVEQPGHTEVLRDMAGVSRVLMLLAGDRLRCALATIHVPLAAVPGLLTTEGLVRDLRLLHQELRALFGRQRPRIAVAGLNPHAGEGGLFGREEIDIIAPAVEAAQEEGLDVHGPLPADACIPAAAEGRWDAVLAMYHDQALPAVKAVAPRRAVNVTLGLPFVRTSVDHGTAFDVAGTGRATPSSLREAVKIAASAAMHRGKTGLNLGDPPADLGG